MRRLNGPVLIVSAWCILICLGGTAAAEGCLGPQPVMGRVLALDPKTGQAKEVFQAKQEDLTKTAAVGDVLYVGSPYLVRAIELPGGKTRWSFKADYLVYDIKPTPKSIFVGSGSTLHAVDPANGKEQWQFVSNGAVGDLILTDGLLIFGHHGGVRAVDQQTGQQRWQLPAPWNEISLGGKGTICAWGLEKTFVGDIKKGEWLWKDDSPGNPAALDRSAVNGVAGDGRLHYLDGVDEAKGTVTVAAVDLVTRQPPWKKTLDARLGKLAFLYLLEGQLLLTSEGDLKGESGVYALDAATGNAQWHFAAGQPVWRFTRPAADMATLYLSDGATKLWAVDRATGKPRWSYTPPPLPAKSGNGYSIRTPTPTPDAIYVTVNELSGFRVAAPTPK